MTPTLNFNTGDSGNRVVAPHATMLPIHPDTPDTPC